MRWLTLCVVLAYSTFLLVIDIVHDNPWWAYLAWALATPTLVLVVIRARSPKS